MLVNKFKFAGYVGLVAAFVIIGLICDFFGTFLTGLGLRSTDPNKKYKYYRVAIYALVVARESSVIALSFIFLICETFTIQLLFINSCILKDFSFAFQ